MRKIGMYIGLFLVLFGLSTFIYNKYSSQQMMNQIAKNEMSNMSVSLPTSEAGSSVESEIMSDSSSEMSIKVANKLDETLSLAPETTFEDAQGQVYQLREMKGLPTVINIWASWCPPCRAEMPYFDAAHQNYQDKVQFLMINATGSSDTETKENVQSFVDEMGLTAPVYYDINFINQIKFGTTSLPTTILLNDRGQVVKIIRGMVSEPQLIDEIESLLQ